MEKRVNLHMKDINEGKEGWYDTAQNVQITIDRINEGSYYVNPKIKDYIVHQLEQKLSTFPQEEVAQATNVERRVALQAGRVNNRAVLDNINNVIQGINESVQKQYDKAGIITHLGAGINADWLGKESSREAYEQKMNEVNMRMGKLISLKNQLTTEEFKQKANELLGDVLNPEAIVSAFKAGEEANAAMGKTYVIAGTAIAVTGGMAAGALAAGGAVAGGATAAAAGTAKTALTVGTVAKGAAIGAGTGAAVGGTASIATDTVDKLTNNTDNAEDFSAEGLAEMAKNAGAAAAMGSAGGAAGGAIASTLMGTTLSTGAKVGLDITANTAVGVGLDYATTGEVTLEGTLMNAGMSALGGISAYRGLKGAAQADATPSTTNKSIDAKIKRAKRKINLYAEKRKQYKKFGPKFLNKISEQVSDYPWLKAEDILGGIPSILKLGYKYPKKQELILKLVNLKGIMQPLLSLDEIANLVEATPSNRVKVFEQLCETSYMHFSKEMFINDLFQKIPLSEFRFDKQ